MSGICKILLVHYISHLLGMEDKIGTWKITADCLRGIATSGSWLEQERCEVIKIRKVASSSAVCWHITEEEMGLSVFQRGDWPFWIIPSNSGQGVSIQQIIRVKYVGVNGM